MSKKIVSVTLLSSLALFAGLAFAAGPGYPTNPERSFATQDVPVAKARAEVQAELENFRKSPVSADGWQYVGGEREWALIPHAFALIGGKLEHADKFAHSTLPGPRLTTTDEEKTQTRDLYRNAL